MKIHVFKIHKEALGNVSNQNFKDKKEINIISKFLYQDLNREKFQLQIY